MPVINQLLRAFRIQHEEKKLFSLSFLFGTLVGIVQGLLIIATVLFLKKNNILLLNYIYIATGFVTFLMGLLFLYLQKRVSVFTLLFLPLLLAFAIIFSFWALFAFSALSWLSIAFIISSTCVISFLSISNLTLLTHFFTLQQGKRLFGLIAGSQSLGSIIAAILLKSLVNLIGSNNIILLASFVILIIVSVVYLIKLSVKHLMQENTSELDSQVAFHDLKNKRYILCIFTLVVLASFTCTAVDLLFNKFAQQSYQSEADLAYFLGSISAISNLLTLFFSFFAFRWVLAKYGTLLALLITAFVVATFIIATFITSIVPSFAKLSFILITLTSLSERIFRQSINGSAITLLYQVLKLSEKSWAQIRHKTVISPLSGVFIGCVLLGFTKRFGIEIHTFSFLILSICIAIFLTVQIIKKDYIKVITIALEKYTLVKPDFFKIDKTIFNELKELIKSPYPDQVIYALQKLEEEEDLKYFTELTVESLKSPLLEVRMYVLKKIERYRIQSAENAVLKICTTEPFTSISTYAFSALGALGGEDNLALIRKKRSDPSLIALIKYGNLADRENALQDLLSKLNSSIKEDKLTSFALLKELHIPNKVTLLLPFLSDKDPHIKLAAFEAITEIEDERLYPLFIENLKSPSIFSALLKARPSLFPYITQNFSRYNVGIQQELIRLLGFRKDEQSTHFLLKFLNYSNKQLYQSALFSLKRGKYKAKTPEQISLINDLMHAEITHIIEMRSYHHQLGAKETKLLRDLLWREIELAQKRYLLLASFLYPDTLLLETALEGFFSQDPNRISNAAEAFLQILEHKHSKEAMPQLLAYRGSTIPVSGKHLEEILKRIFYKSSTCYLSMLSSAVIYTIGMIPCKNLAPLVREADLQSDRFMAEMVAWTLPRLS